MADRYWIGGTGNWSDTAHWSATSGGPGGVSVPSAVDNAYFDANSFGSAGQTVTLDVSPDIRTLSFDDVTNTPTLNCGASTVPTIRGTLFLSPSMSLSGSLGGLIFDSTAPGNEIALHGQSLPIGNFEMKFTGGGEWLFLDAYDNTSGQIFIQEGAVRWADNIPGDALRIRNVFDGHAHGVPSGVVVCNFGANNIYIVDSLDFSGEAPATDSTLIADQATITFEPDIDFTLILLNGAPSIAAVRIYQGVNTGGVNVNFGGAVIGSLWLQAGPGTYSLAGWTIPNIDNDAVNGGDLVRVSGSFTASGTIISNFFHVETSAVSGSTPAWAVNSVDGGGNQNWAFPASPVVTAAEVYPTGLELRLTLDQDMGDPAGNEAAFTVYVNAAPVAVVGISLSPPPNVIALDLAEQVFPGDVVAVDYVFGNVQSEIGSLLQEFSGQAVTNDLAFPVFVSAETTTDGTGVLLTCSLPMNTAPGQESEFSLLVDGLPRVFNNIAVDTDPAVIILGLDGAPLAAGAVVVISYTPGSVESLYAGFPLVAFAGEPVTDSVVPPPTLLSAVVSQRGTLLTLTFDQEMANPAGNESFFSLSRVGGPNPYQVFGVIQQADDPTIAYMTITFPLTEGADYLLSYAGGTIESAAVLPLADFADFAVTNGAGAPDTGSVLWGMIGPPRWPPSEYLPPQ